MMLGLAMMNRPSLVTKASAPNETTREETQILHRIERSPSQFLVDNLREPGGDGDGGCEKNTSRDRIKSHEDDGGEHISKKFANACVMSTFLLLPTE